MAPFRSEWCLSNAPAVCLLSMIVIDVPLVEDCSIAFHNALITQMLSSSNVALNYRPIMAQSHFPHTFCQIPRKMLDKTLLHIYQNDPDKLLKQYSYQVSGVMDVLWLNFTCVYRGLSSIAK